MSNRAPTQWRFLYPLAAGWEWLTRPAAVIRQRDMQRQARLLSSLLLVVITVGVLLVLTWELFYAPASPFWRSDFFLEIGVLALLAGIYLMSRTRRYVLAAALTIGIVTLAIFGVAASTNDPERANLLAYLLVPVVVCSLFLSLRATALLIALNTTGILLFPVFFEEGQFWNPWAGYTIFLSAIVLFAAYYQSRLEEDRRAALRESEEKFRLIFENAFDGISIHEDIVVDDSHRVRLLLDCNARYAEMAGRSREELLHSRDTVALQRNIGPARTIEQERAILREGIPHQGFFSWIRPDGRENIIEYQAQPIRQGNKMLTIGLDRDITERARAENALRESEERYRLLMESADAAISMVNREGTFLFMNSVAARSLGGEPRDFTGQTVFDLFPPEAADIHVTDIRRVIESGQGTVIEAPTVVAGEPRWYRTSLQPIRDSAGTVTSALVIAYDITERKHAESALRQSEAKTRALLNAIPDLMFQLTEEGEFIDYKAADMGLVVPPDQFLGRKVAEVLPDLSERVMRSIEQALQTGETQVFQYQLPLGYEMHDYEARIVASGDHEAVAIVRDITERARSETALRESEARYRELFDNMTSGVAVYEPSQDGNTLLIKDINEAGQHISRVRKRDIIGRDVREVFPGVEAVGLWDVFRTVRETGVPAHHPSSLYQDDRLVQWVENYVYRLPSGEIVAVYDDVTERKQAEEALRRHDAILEAAAFSAERFLTVPGWERSIQEVLERLGKAAGVERVYIFENEQAEDGTSLTSQRFEWAAPGVESQIDDPRFQAVPWRAGGFGRWEETLSRGEAVVGHVWGFPPSEQAVLSSQGILSLLDMPVFAGQRWWGFIGFDECRAEREWTEPEIEAVKVVANTLGAAIQRQRAEAALRESEEKFRSIVEQSHEGITLADRNGILIEWNRALEEITGLTREEALGRTMWDVQFSVRPEDEKTPELYEQIKLASMRQFEVDRPSAVSQTYEHEIQCPDGTRKIVQTVGFPISNEDSFMMCGILRDVTSQKQAEEQRLRLGVELEKVKLLSDFVRNVSHEFRTPLSVMYTGLEILERAATLDDASAQRVEHMKAQAMYISDLVDAMLMMAHLDSDPQLAFAPVDLSLMARDIGTEVRTLAQQKDQTLTLDLAEGLPPVRADVGKLRHALVNLCKNAIQFTPSLGSITLRTYAHDQCAVIEVVDTGIGLDEQDLPHIFERFYRADKARTGRHAGLGLAIAQKIVAAHRGRIEVDSAPGQGSTFRVILPGVSE
jgi:PAS domain S-box-containing protein